MDAEAFANEIRRAYPLLHTIALALLGDRHLAEDVVQEASLAGMRKIGDFVPGSNFIAWMAQFIRKIAANERRKRQRRSISLVDPGTIARTAGVANSTLGPVDSRGRLDDHQTSLEDDVVAALKHLGEIPRACLLLREIHETSYREIAAALGIPEGTAMSHVHHAKKTLLERLRHRRPPNFEIDQTKR